MQKVSKQSLAMLALSILLAISIALTFTFAALTNTKTAEGTITFSGSVGLVVDATSNIATSESDSEKYTFNIENPTTAEEINTALAGVSFKLVSTSQSAYIRITAVSSNETAVPLTATASVNGYDKSNLVWTSSAAVAAAQSTKALSDFFTAGLDLTQLDGSSGAIADVKITFTIEASAKAFGAA